MAGSLQIPGSLLAGNSAVFSSHGRTRNATEYIQKNERTVEYAFRQELSTSHAARVLCDRDPVFHHVPLGDIPERRKRALSIVCEHPAFCILHTSCDRETALQCTRAAHLSEEADPVPPALTFRPSLGRMVDSLSELGLRASTHWACLFRADACPALNDQHDSRLEIYGNCSGLPGDVRRFGGNDDNVSHYRDLAEGWAPSRFRVGGSSCISHTSLLFNDTEAVQNGGADKLTLKKTIDKKPLYSIIDIL